MFLYFNSPQLQRLKDYWLKQFILLICSIIWSSNIMKFKIPESFYSYQKIYWYKKYISNITSIHTILQTSIYVAGRHLLSTRTICAENDLLSKWPRSGTFTYHLFLGKQDNRTSEWSCNSEQCFKNVNFYDALLFKKTLQIFSPIPLQIMQSFYFLKTT